MPKCDVDYQLTQKMNKMRLPMSKGAGKVAFVHRVSDPRTHNTLAGAKRKKVVRFNFNCNGRKLIEKSI